MGCYLHHMHLRMRLTSATIQSTSSAERPSRGTESPPACWQSITDHLTIILLFPFFYEYYTTMCMCLHDCVCTVSEAVHMCVWLIVYWFYTHKKRRVCGHFTKSPRNRWEGLGNRWDSFHSATMISDLRNDDLCDYEGIDGTKVLVGIKCNHILWHTRKLHVSKVFMGEIPLYLPWWRYLYYIAQMVMTAVRWPWAGVLVISHFV